MKARIINRLNYLNLRNMRMFKNVMTGLFEVLPKNPYWSANKTGFLRGDIQRMGKQWIRISWISFYTFTLCFLAGCNHKSVFIKEPAIYRFAELKPRWSSPENFNGRVGNGGKENNGAKGHPFDSIPAGKSLELLHIQEAGIIQRIWITIDNRSPEMLRSLRIDMYWDDNSKPAVSVPFGDFFGVGLGRTATFQNVFFANPEGRSFNCFIPMPFKKGARISVTNESSKSIAKIFYDVDYNLVKSWDEDILYFHAYWHRDTATVLGKDFDLLPEIKGRGRFLGVNIGVSENPVYGKSWFGEGEVKMYLDGDTDFPTLNGTGTEDYIGSAWGQGKFTNPYMGCTIGGDSLAQWSFYRYHVPDPIYFSEACRVTIQQLGGNLTANVEKSQKNGASLIPVAIDTGTMFLLYQNFKKIEIDTMVHPKGWVNFYRSDDVSATSYFYLDRPSSELPVIQNVFMRTCNLRTQLGIK